MNDFKLFPVCHRADEEIVLSTARGLLQVGSLRAAAGKLADDIRALWPDRSHAPCLLVSSTDPFEFVIGLMACWQAGAVAACWSESSLSREELAALTSAEGVLVNRAGEYRIEVLTETPWLARHPGNLIVATSGSTGVPKGVSLNLESVATNAFLAGASIGLDGLDCAGWAIDIDFGLMSALNHFLMAWQFRLTLHHLGGRTDEEKRALFTGQRLGFGGAPLQLTRLAETLAGTPGPVAVVSSGDFLVPDVVARVQNAFPECRVNSFYGLTEVSGRFCVHPHKELVEVPDRTGRPMPGFGVRLREASEVLEGVVEGEVEVSTPLLFNGYYRMGEKFERVEPGSWFATGDLGQLQGGYLRLLGRADDVFKVSGQKVDRVSIERALAPLMGQAEFCVLPVAHSLIGQCPALFMAPRGDGAGPTWAQIIRHLKQELPSRYLPMHGYRLPALPRLANGKLNKRKMVAEHEGYERLM